MDNIIKFLNNLNIEDIINEIIKISGIGNIKDYLKDTRTLGIAGGSIADIVIYKYLTEYKNKKDVRVPRLKDVDLYVTQYNKLYFLSSMFDNYNFTVDSDYEDMLIKKSIIIDKLNIIIVRETNNIEEIINEFDINTCMVGLYYDVLEDNFKLYFSYEFVKFLYNNTINIINTQDKNIASTCLRLLKYYSKWGLYFRIDFYEEYKKLYDNIQYVKYNKITKAKLDSYINLYGNKIMNNKYWAFIQGYDDRYELTMKNIFKEIDF